MIENYSNDIFTKGAFSIRSMYLPNQKGRGQRYEGQAFTAHKVSTSNNNKYTTGGNGGPQTLSYVSSSGGFFLSFSYNKYDANSRTSINEDVMLSYPHLHGLSKLLNELIDAIKGGKVFTPDNSQLVAGAETMMFKSEPFASGKQVIFVPEVGTVYQNNQQVSAVGFRVMVADVAKSEFLPLSSVIQIITQLLPLSEPFNFRTEARFNEQAALAIETNNLLKKLLVKQGVDHSLTDSRYQFSNNGNNTPYSSYQQQSQQNFQGQQQGGFNPFTGQQQAPQQHQGWGQSQQQAPQPNFNPFSQQSAQESSQQETNPFTTDGQTPRVTRSEQPKQDTLQADDSRKEQASSNPFVEQPKQEEAPKKEEPKEAPVTNSSGSNSDLKNDIFAAAAEVDTSSMFDEDIEI